MTRTLNDLLLTARAFQESRVLLSAIELDLFRAIGEGSTATEVASKVGAQPRSTEMLLNALVALEALEKSGAQYRCTPLSTPLAGARSDLMHAVRKWDSWSTLTECVRTGTTQRAPGDRRDPDDTETFIGAMHARALTAAPGLVEAIRFDGPARMLDIGGGSGAFSMALVQANLGLTAEVLDLPPVVPITERHIRDAGLGDRVKARAGDLRNDAFGRDYDVLLASAICHMLSEEENQDLFRRCASALKPGGRLVLREFILDPDRTAPKESALFALNMLVSTAHGNVYTELEYRASLEAAGFRAIERHRNGEDLMIAVKN